ncbi:NADH dehydrogenase [ubiquinone] 1 alpha subcomplex subunit 3 [Fukomys damarensis]|uniref:NADH dehydrogenase [ubiquinone] 1 alpha subcomplex subunit 3 n=1 Tax=Fukomys damarensis TaxID=885580 RepID=A0A091DTL7_FUKDA|nr:NADH dehydrogenase [ubiquinone] 1 alpha subcomplex subunit 3 [Fukomys damarensis]
MVRGVWPWFKRSSYNMLMVVQDDKSRQKFPVPNCEPKVEAGMVSLCKGGLAEREKQMHGLLVPPAVMAGYAAAPDKCCVTIFPHSFKERLDENRSKTPHLQRSPAIALLALSPYPKYSSVINQAIPYSYPVPVQDDRNMTDVHSHL